MNSTPRFFLPVFILMIAFVSTSAWAQSARMHSTDLGNIDINNTTNATTVARPPVVEPVKPEEHQGKGRLGFRLVFLPNGLPQIAGMTEGGPAADAGLKLGDLILKIDRNPTLALSQDDVRLSLHGEPGTGVELSIERNDNPLLIVVAVQRKILPADAHDIFRGGVPGQLYQPDPNEVSWY